MKRITVMPTHTAAAMCNATDKTVLANPVLFSPPDFQVKEPNTVKPTGQNAQPRYRKSARLMPDHNHIGMEAPLVVRAGAR